MHPLPHRYAVLASVGPDSEISLESFGVPRLVSDAPIEFDGSGTRWSPETLLTAAVADCLALTFRGVARARHLAFLTLRCDVEGTLDRVEGRTAFTAFHVRAHLRVPAGTSLPDAERALVRAKETCLVTNSLTATTTWDMEVTSDATADVEHLSGATR
jgi:uncharacterized OsmC-like protein